MPKNVLRLSPALNSVLIPNTSIVEASRLLAYGAANPSDREGWRGRWDDSKPTSAVKRLIEFCNVSEAVVLNDNVYTLPSKDPEDVRSESLSSILRETGIRKELESGELSQKAIIQL